MSLSVGRFFEGFYSAAAVGRLFSYFVVANVLSAFCK